ncbi:hypothetical protein EBU71_17075, partial [bacterium]|nr:hypothetical protein [Candidatus Elulimicrobium humile]
GHYNGIKLATGNIYPDNSQSLTINTTGTGVLTLSGNSILINAVTSATFNTSTFVLGSLEATRFNEIEVSKGLGSISRVRPSLTNNNLFLVGNGSGTVFIGTASRVTNVVGGLSVNETAIASRFNDLVIDYSTSTNLTVYPFNTNQGLNIQGNGTGNIGLSATRVQVTATTVINGPLTANSFNDLTFTRSGNSATVTISSLLTNQNITISPNGTGTTTISSNLQVGGVIKETVLDLVALQSGNNVTLTTSNIIANIITANPTIATSDVFLPAAGAATSGYRLLFRNRSTLFSINVRDTSTSFLAVISTVSNRTIVSDGFNWFVQ